MKHTVTSTYTGVFVNLVASRRPLVTSRIMPFPGFKPQALMVQKPKERTQRVSFWRWSVYGMLKIKNLDT